MQKFFISFILFVTTLSVYAQLDVAITDTNSFGGKIKINNTQNVNHAFTGLTNGFGVGVFGCNTASTGLRTGIMGTSESNSPGTGAILGVTGVSGQILLTSPGAYSAGVRGINSGTGGNGIGVIGYQAGSGSGVYGETPSGFGVYGLASKSSGSGVGVKGETVSADGIAVEARYNGTGIGTALEIDNGTIRVAGNNKAAFVHIATVATKLSSNGTIIDNPMCNEDPNCMLFVTQKLNDGGTIYNNSPIGVYYDPVKAKWGIFNQNNTAIPTNAEFNVLIIKQ